MSTEITSTAERHYKKMTETPVAKLVIMLGIPTTISMLITNLYNLADTYFVGELGESQQGAIGVLFTLQSIIQACAFSRLYRNYIAVCPRLRNVGYDILPVPCVFADT